jgi:hypothetical protein
VRVPAPPIGSHGIVSDPAFASDGEQYVRMTAHFDPRFNQRFQNDPAQGRTFQVEFDARVDAARPFDEPLIEVGHPTDTSVTSRYSGFLGWRETGPLSASTWQHFLYEWTFSPTMPAGEYEFGVGLRHNLLPGEPVDTQYTGFLDNVTVTQTPEPAAVAAVGFIVAGAVLRRRRGN